MGVWVWCGVGVVWWVCVGVLLLVVGVLSCSPRRVAVGVSSWCLSGQADRDRWGQ